MNLSEEVRQAIQTQVAAGILQSIKQEDRDAILHKSIVEALQSWQVSNAIRDLVVDEVRDVVAEMLAEEHWQRTLRDHCQKVINRFANDLATAIPKALLEAIAGVDGSYNSDRSPGRLLVKYMPKE